MCKLFEVDLSRLATLKFSQDTFGEVQGIPLKAVVGDQQAALFALGGQVMVNLGTLAAIGVPTGGTPPITRSFLRAIFHSSSSDVCYLVEASTPACGQLLDRLRSKRQFVAPKVIEDDLRTVLFSAIGGTGSPEYRPLVTNLIKYWNGREADLDQAIIENIGNSVATNLRLLSGEGFLSTKKELMVTGGLAAIEPLLGQIASISGMELSVVDDAEASAWGAALLAAGGLLKPNLKIVRKVAPVERPDTRERYETWKSLRQMALSGCIEKELQFEF